MCACAPAHRRCDRCQASVEFPSYRYILSLSAQDHTGQEWLSGFGEVGEIIMVSVVGWLVCLVGVLGWLFWGRGGGGGGGVRAKQVGVVGLEGWGDWGYAQLANAEAPLLNVCTWLCLCTLQTVSSACRSQGADHPTPH